jgi:hypothetical protein
MVVRFWQRPNALEMDPDKILLAMVKYPFAGKKGDVKSKYSSM